MSNLDSTTPLAAAAVEMGTAEGDSTTASVSALNGTRKRKKKKNKSREQQKLPSDLDSTAAAEVEEHVEAKGNEVEEQEATDAAASALNGTPKRKKKKMKRNKTLEQQELPPDLDSTAAAEAEEQLEAKGNEVEEQEATDAAASDLNGTPKRKKKKMKRNKTLEQQELPPDLDSTAAAEAEEQLEAKGNEVEEQEATNAAASALNGTPKRKKKKKKKKNKTREQQELPPDLDSTAAAEAEEQLEAKGNKVEEQEATNAAASAMEGTRKCNEDAKVKVNLMPEKEANTTVVSVSESTPKRKKRRKKKNKMQGQLDSAKASPSVVAMDIIVADKSENGCIDVIGVSRHADVNMDPINGDDPSSAQSKSKANDADVSLKNKDGNKGNKNCTENSGLLQERSAGTKRRRGKRKRASGNGGPGFSSDNGGVVANHGLSCICASCLVEAHEENIQNIYSPRGSLVRFRRKKLLILDLNGLLADINQDYHNAHLAHAKVRTKLVFRRPYCDDFLRFCFQNFELGIWSSRKRENVKSVVDILMRDLKPYLLFCWDMSHCTVTGCKTIDNKDKPLVLKELKKIWNKDVPNLPWEQGEFSPSNTLLVDDSPYKALCNPPNTAIFPEPYSYLNQRDDFSLGPGGDLRVYLERIAAADNVQNFVRDNPFGQKSITESDPNWNFYVEIVDKMEKKIVGKWKRN